MHVHKMQSFGYWTKIMSIFFVKHIKVIRCLNKHNMGEGHEFQKSVEAHFLVSVYIEGD